MKRELLHFAAYVLHGLENDPMWSTKHLENIAAEAHRLGLARKGIKSGGLFEATVDTSALLALRQEESGKHSAFAQARPVAWLFLAWSDDSTQIEGFSCEEDAIEFRNEHMRQSLMDTDIEMLMEQHGGDWDSIAEAWTNDMNEELHVLSVSIREEETKEEGSEEA